MPDEKQRYVAKYYPVQFFGIWKGENGWAAEQFGSERHSEHCAVIINGEGSLEIIDPFKIPEDEEIRFIPAQKGTYAVFQELSDDERYFIGYITQEYRPTLRFIFGDIYELTLSPKMVANKESIKVCEDCKHIYSVYEPDFCIHCGSTSIRRAGIDWIKEHLPENVCLGIDARY